MATPQTRTAVTASVSAPTGGWNARDSIANMPPLDAVTLNNFFPTPTDVQIRLGYQKTSTGITGQVNSLMNWAGASTQKLFAVAGSVLYDASASTAVSKVTSLSNDKWQHVNMATTGGNHFLVCCNGVDPAMLYDGTNWIKYASTSTAQTISSITRGGTGNLTATVTTSSPHGLITGNQIVITGATPTQFNGTYLITKTGNSTFTYTMASAPANDATVVGTYTINYAITGIDSTKLVHVNLFKNFLFFVETGSLRAWYLPIGQVAGAASPLDFGGYARMGGFLQAMGTWTLDAGQGADDYAVWVTNNGEVIVYTGTNPSDSTAWGLEGIWQLGQTFNRRCFLKFAGDLLLLTQDGLCPLASSLQSSRLDPRINLTDKIFYEISREISLYSTNFGWQIIYFARENMLIINVPSTEGIQQYCMHTISKAWCSFTDVNATCWEMNFDNLYFGGNGYVAQFWDGYSDAGNNINAQVQQAYSYFDAPGQLKRFTMIRPIFQTDNGLPGVLVGINTDFDAQNSLGSVSFNAVSTTLGTWDNATWDNQVWGGDLALTKLWQGVTGIGYSGGIVMKVATQGIDVHWVSSDYVMEKGGVL
jgi:hypothetical protein